MTCPTLYSGQEQEATYEASSYVQGSSPKKTSISNPPHPITCSIRSLIVVFVYSPDSPAANGLSNVLIMADNIYPHTTTIPAPASFESQDSFEVSDFFELADWIDDDAIDVVAPPLPSTHGHTSHHPVYSSNEILVNTSDGISISSSSSSSFLDGPTNRKTYTYVLIEMCTFMHFLRD